MLPLSQRTLVFCPHPGCLQQYGILLNRLEVFHLSLCLNLGEVTAALRSGQHYHLFIYDKFSLSEDDFATLLRLSRNDAIQQFVLVGSFSELERLELLEWAWHNRVPLLQILERPFSLAQLRMAITSLVDYGNSHVGGFRDGQPAFAMAKELSGMPGWPA
ncbi:hypothetical protein [Pseudomonas panipatensis]|uniref:hypothetical protein n=1 Tax=Pseudomonas panipatensis TaxID=428992 RepID=UPI0035B1A61E